MKFLIAVNSEAAKDNIEECAEDGEPVIPAFPVGPDSNRFLGLKTFKPCQYAWVREIGDDPDDLVDNLHQEFLGMPKALLEDMVVWIIKAVRPLDQFDNFQVFVGPGWANLRSGVDGEITELWKDVDMSKYL
jgi:hypothetical protein